MHVDYTGFVNRFSATPVGAWLGRNVAARLDPVLLRISGGRFSTTGVPTIPMCNLTTTGRKSGQPRTVTLGYLRDGDDVIVVASNFGQEHHPAWRYNLEANPSARVSIGKESWDVVAEVVPEDEREALWPRLDAIVPQYAVYRTRTDRSIRLFRLRRAGSPPA